MKVSNNVLRAGLLGFSVGLQAGCGGTDVSTGSEGSTLDASHCFAGGCDDKVDTLTLPAPAHVTCAAELPGAFVEDFRVDDPLGSVLALRVAPDGTFWVLHDDTSDLNSHSIWLEHYDADATLLGRTASIGEGSTPTESRLSVDAQGNGWLVVYRNQSGATADDDYSENVTLRSYDYDGSPLVTRSFSSLAASVAAVGADGEATVAGNAARYEARGTVLRLDADGDVLWTQPNLRTNGGAQGPGVAALVVHADGSSTVLAGRSHRSSGGGVAPGLGSTIFGLARVGADGSAVWDALLDSSFIETGSVQLAADASGGLFITGNLDSSRALLESFPADGSTGFAFEYDAPMASDVAIAEGTGELVTQAGRSAFLVAAPDGSSCGLVRIAWAKGEGPYGLRSLAPTRGGFYYGEQWGFGRFRRE